MKDLPAVQDFDTMKRMSMALYKSGYFADVKSEAQAIVKVMAGAELGLPPFASMSGINIIQGKPSLGANLQATLIKNDPRYDYRISTSSDEMCSLNWYEGGERVGSSTFTIDEARSISQYNGKKKKWETLVDKHNWKNYPSDMLFARAITRGARRFAPGIFGGAPVYTPEELGADTDQDGNVVEGELMPEPSKNSAGPDWTEPEPVTDEETIEQIFGSPAISIPADVDTNDLLIGTAEESESASEKTGEPKFNGKVEDARAWLDGMVKDGVIELGFIGDAACMTRHYKNWPHFKAAVTPNEETGNPGFDFPDGFNIVRKMKVTKAGAATIFDWAMERKKETNDD